MQCFLNYILWNISFQDANRFPSFNRFWETFGKCWSKQVSLLLRVLKMLTWFFKRTCCASFFNLLAPWNSLWEFSYGTHVPQNFYVFVNAGVIDWTPTENLSRRDLCSGSLILNQATLISSFWLPLPWKIREFEQFGHFFNSFSY